MAHSTFDLVCLYGGIPEGQEPKNKISLRAEIETAIAKAEARLPESARPTVPNGWQGRSALEARLASAHSKLIAKQPPPLPGAAGRTSLPVGVVSLEARVAELERELAKAKAAPSPAAGARIVETAARTTATQLSAERRSGVPVGGWPKQEAMPRCPDNITGQARKDWYRQMDTFGPDTAKYSPDAILRGMVNHGSTSEEDRKTANAELTRRGWTYDESAKCWSKSLI